MTSREKENFNRQIRSTPAGMAYRVGKAVVDEVRRTGAGTSESGNGSNRPGLGSGLVEDAARALEERQNEIDKTVEDAEKGKDRRDRR